MHLSPADCGHSTRGAAAAKQTGCRDGGSNEEPPATFASDTAAAISAAASGSGDADTPPAVGGEPQLASSTSTLSARCLDEQQVEACHLVELETSVLSTDGNEIVIDSRAMAQSSGRATVAAQSIRVRAIDEERVDLKQEAYSSQNNSSKLVDEETHLNNLSRSSLEDELQEAAASNNLVKFFSHYKGKYSFAVVCLTERAEPIKRAVASVYPFDFVARATTCFASFFAAATRAAVLTRQHERHVRLSSERPANFTTRERPSCRFAESRKERRDRCKR